MRHSLQRITGVTLITILTASIAVAGARYHRRHTHAPPPTTKEKVVVRSGNEPPASASILPNGGFQRAAKDGTHPAHWQAVDDLVYFWTHDPQAPSRGKVIRIDTDVLQSQAYHWWIAHFVHHKPLSDAPRRRIPRGHQYNTIGGLDGGFYWSGFVRIPPDATVRVYVDAKGPPSKVFIRGYTQKFPLHFAAEEPAVQEAFRKARHLPMLDKHGHQIMHRLHYVYTTWFPVGGSKHWKTYTHSMARHPNDNEFTHDVRYIRIMLYPYWPAGTYWYDNVRVVLLKNGKVVKSP